jgi:hypothetical protein
MYPVYFAPGIYVADPNHVSAGGSGSTGEQYRSTIVDILGAKHILQVVALVAAPGAVVHQVCYALASSFS